MAIFVLLVGEKQREMKKTLKRKISKKKTLKRKVSKNAQKNNVVCGWEKGIFAKMDFLENAQTLFVFGR